MPTTPTDPLADFLSKLDGLGRIGKELSKKSTARMPSPFVQKELLSAAVMEAEKLGLPSSLATAGFAKLDAECLKQRSEFWDRFGKECQRRGWSVVGSTERRLIAWALVLEVGDTEAVVEESGLALSPYAPEVALAVEAELAEASKHTKDPQKFMDLLAQAFDTTPGDQEKPIENVFRAAVWLSQKPGFWKTLQPGSFMRLSRSAFRLGLSAIMEKGLRAKDGRTPRFGTAVAGAYWEVYSPGEGRVVQVGRISLS